MCALILFHRVVPGFPVVLGANRDEFYDRPAGPPIVVDARIPFVAPQDLRAGGTWVGTNAAGLTVAITNRPDAGDPPGGVSRGTLVKAVLAFGSAAAARVYVRDKVAAAAFGGFNLVFADDRDAFVATRRDSIGITRLDPGHHVVTNLHDPNQLSIASVNALAVKARHSSLLDTVAELAEILESTDPVVHVKDMEQDKDKGGFALNKDFGNRGTRSSTIIARGPIARGPSHTAGLFLHADGPPHATPYQDYANLLRAISRPPR